MNTIHTFFIPVMGTGFSIDTPLKVAKYGIDSVVSLVDDTLIEQMRKFYCQEYNEHYSPVTKHDPDCRARRITEYLNLLDRVVKKQFEDLKKSSFGLGSEINKYFELLPETSQLKKMYRTMLETKDKAIQLKLQDKLRSGMRIGRIDVNIMTKLDKLNYDKDGNALPGEFSDALAALRGYAKSSLDSAIVFSAGINQRLYSYVAEFKDFYADVKGVIKKKIILKVSDYRSSLIQGSFFAKKGLWISEFRVESGLNCGGHAFATKGLLMGPILEEFRNKRNELVSHLHTIYTKALKIRNQESSDQPLATQITAQGGIGTASEDEFLLSHYGVEQTGWATPFLLCPEATRVDDETLARLIAADEDDLSVSDISPLNVAFNDLNNSPSNEKKRQRIQKGTPGSPCAKSYLEFNTEFTKIPLCIASRRYQRLKLEELQSVGLSEEEFEQRKKEITTKACICHDLGGGARIKCGITTPDKDYTAICPGPNLAYFSKEVTLQEIIDHIYGKDNILNNKTRPHMFIKELRMYVEHFLKEIQKHTNNMTKKQKKLFSDFRLNLLEGISYYKTLFPAMKKETQSARTRALDELQEIKDRIENCCSHSA